MTYLPLLFPLILAFCYRARGGAIPLGSDTLARTLFWGLPVGAICGFIAYAHHFPLWLALPCAVMAFAGACIGHSSEQGNTPEQHVGMSYITGLMLFLILLPFYAYMAWYSLDIWRLFILMNFLGFLGGVGYWIGYKYPFNLKLFGVQWVTAGDASGPELLTGFLAFGLPLMILGMI